MDQGTLALFLVGLVGAGLRMATPILFATMGELLSERAGVLNLGIEGTMLMGAAVGFLVTLYSGNAVLGVAAAVGAGVLLGLLMAALTVGLGLSQHVSGLGITLMCTGLSMFLYRLTVGSPTTPPTIQPFAPVHIPFLSDLPFVGSALFQHYALTWLAFAVVAAMVWLLLRSGWGLTIRAVGDKPFAADAAGIAVARVRTLALAAGGGLMGLGGAFLTLAHQNMFLPDVVGGRGWVAIAMVIFGNWNPWYCALGAVGFGFLDALQLRLQGLGLTLPLHLFLVIPYLLTLLALVLMSRRAAVPAALLHPYRREDRG